MKKNILFIMPFGDKGIYKFDEIYADFKKELSPKYNVHRVDQMVGNDIDGKMYKGIVSADVVIADLTLENANVFYELGIRHALRTNRTILVSQETTKIPFDISHVGIIAYSKPSDIINQIVELIEKHENDSVVLKSLEHEDPVDFNKYAAVFSDWEEKYEKTSKTLNDFKDKNHKLAGEEALKAWQHALEYANNQSKFFSPKFEPIVTAKALFTYKAGNEDRESLERALKILEPLKPQTSNSYEVLGLYASIQNKKAKLISSQSVSLDALDASRRFLSNMKTNYSIGVSIMSYVECVKNNYMSKELFAENINILKDIFSRVTYANEEDAKWFKETELLLNYAIDRNVKLVGNESSSTKLNYERIKEIIYG